LDRRTHDFVRRASFDLRVSGASGLFEFVDLTYCVSPLRKHLPLNHRTRRRKPGIIVKYAKLKPNCQDQLAPFEGRWGFDSNQGFYHGTIFRFPLRSIGQGSELIESGICPDTWMTIRVFRELFDEARLALLFLRKIATIDFNVKADVDVGWRVRRGKWPEEGTFSDWANVIAEQRSGPDNVNTTTEQWWRAIEDVRNAPVELQHRHRRRMKYVECGIAALVPQSQKDTGPSLNPFKSRFFNCLPLKFESTLPVQIHASFLLSGDRQNIAAEETSQDAGSEWNKWLLQKELPRIYLKFLEDIGRKVGQDVYNYFPVESSQGHDLLSDLIRVSFWENIQSSRCQLFPVVEASQDLNDPRTKGRKNRTAPNLITFERAVFDVLEQRDSEALQPLLDNCLDDLVRPRVQLARHIRRVPEVKVLTPAIVRGILKSARAMEYVEKAKQSHEGFLDTLLSFIMPTTTDEVVELDGCPVLPLANGKLGTLLLKSKITKSGSDRMYFSADAKVHDLFAFASPLLAANKGNKKFLEKILDSNLLNLKPLEKSDVGVVLGLKESWTPESTPKTWLYRFWKYMNSTTPPKIGSAAQEALDLDSLQHFPLLLLLHRNSKETFDSLHNFKNNPVVVHSTNEEHMNLFRQFPGLAVVDAETIPKPYCDTEKSLLYRDSINRFLKSLNLLAVRNGTTVTEFVKGNLDKKNTQVSRLCNRHAVGDMLKRW
jgi:sacsin